MRQASLQLHHSTGDLVPEANLASVVNRRSGVCSMATTSSGRVVTSRGVTVGVYGGGGLDGLGSCVSTTETSLSGKANVS